MAKLRHAGDSSPWSRKGRLDSCPGGSDVTSGVRSVSLFIGVVTLLMAAAVVPEEATALPLRQRELSPTGAWCWFGDPRAVYHVGAHRRTYVGWVNGGGDIQVASYDHDTGQRVVAT